MHLGLGYQKRVLTIIIWFNVLIKSFVFGAIHKFIRL